MQTLKARKQMTLIAQAPARARIAAMEVLGLDHVQLAMPANGEDLARKFYRDALGIPEIPKPPHLAERGGCWFEHGDLRIHLGVDPDFRPARKAHPALLVRNLEALVQRLAAFGFPASDGKPLDGYRRVDVFDPFGNRIELMQRVAKDPR